MRKSSRLFTIFNNLSPFFAIVFCSTHFFEILEWDGSCKFNPFKQVRACADGCVCVKFVSTCMSAFVSTYMFEAYFTDDKQGRPSVPNKGLRVLKFSSNRGKDDCLDGMTFVITGAKCMCVLQTCWALSAEHTLSFRESTINHHDRLYVLIS